MMKNRVLHPFFFAAYPVLALLAFNVNQANLEDALRPLLLTLGLTALLFGLLTLLLRDVHRAGLLVSLYLLLFFAYGHLIKLLTPVVPVNLYDLNRYVTAVLAALLIVATWGIWRLLKRDIGGLTYFLNIVPAVALIWPFYTIVVHTVRQMAVTATPTAVALEGAPVSTPPPDIYYIILDGYTRADVLQEVFHHDNSDFIAFLEENNFFVADNGRSNYAQTSLSLSSSLNFTYMDEVAAQIGPDSEDRNPLTPLIIDSKLRAFLAQFGYQTVAISSGWRQSEFRNADHYFTSGASMINEFEGLLLQDTWPGTLYITDLNYEMKRQRVLFIFETLESIPTLPGPKFVFAHLYAPHNPLVFGPNGERVRPTDYDLEQVLIEGIDLNIYLEAYSDEVTYLNKRLMAAISTILGTSAQPPIIIIQGDHGSRAYLDWYSLENTCVKERLSILNAYHLPDGGAANLYASITPVNSFRVILDTYFGTDLGLLPDESYFSLWHRPYDFMDVTHRFEPVCQGRE